MNYSIRFTDNSVYNLKELLKFYAKVLSEEKVIKIQSKILNQIDNLKSNPLLNQQEILLIRLNEGHRRLVVSKYIKVIYLIRDNVIIISDIFDSRRDPNKMKT